MPGLNASHTAVLGVFHHGVQDHGKDMPQRYGFHGPAGITRPGLVAAHLGSVSHRDALDGVDCGYRISPGKVCTHCRSGDVGDIGSHLWDDGD